MAYPHDPASETLSRQRTIVITGAASGIGQATVQACRAAGDRVIGVDLSGTDICADLSTPEGRANMAAEVERMAPQGIDGLLAGAGISRPHPDTVAVNHFGAVATLKLLRPLLGRSPRPRAVAICSTAAMLPCSDAIVEACLAGDEAGALALCAADPATAYAASKKALTLWLRAAAVMPEWAGSGISLNAISPGVVLSPMTEPLLADPVMRAAIDQSNPIATANFALPAEIAGVIRYLLSVETPYLLGQVLFVDGGTEALLRPRHF